jgi:hypothetical protein
VSYQEVKLAPGAYTATVDITAAYRKLLRINASDGRATVQLKVVEAPKEEVAQRVSARSASPAPTPLVGKAVKPRGPLPDLRSLPAWAITVDKGRYLTFAATVWNAGPSPLVVDGFKRTGRDDLMDAYQYFFDGKGKQVGYAPVGTTEWDARDGHTHWHFTAFAKYSLLDERKRLVVRSQKEAFCLASTDAIDYTVPGANWRPFNTDLSSACGGESSLGVREVLETGSGDTYAQYLPGQSFDLRSLKNGVYYILIEANPDKRLSEKSTRNNRSYRKVTVAGTTGHRTVKAAKVGIIIEPPIETAEDGH